MNQGTIGHRLIAPRRLVLAVVAAVAAALWLVPVALATPDAPAGLEASSTNEGVVLRWADPNDPAIIGYQYRYKVKGALAWQNVTADDPAGTLPAADAANGLSVADATAGWREVVGDHAGTITVTVSGLTNGTEYDIELRAVYADGTDADGPGDPPSAVAGTGPADPGPAESVTGTAGNPLGNFRAVPRDNLVTLSWSNPGDSSIQKYTYTLEQRTTVGGDFADASPASGDVVGATASTPSGTISGLTVGTEYRVTVTDSPGASRSSVTTFVAGKPLPTLSASATGNSVTLRWGDIGSVGLDVHGSFRFRMSTDGGKTWLNASGTEWYNVVATADGASLPGTEGATVTLPTPETSRWQFTVNNLVVGATYTFQVAADPVADPVNTGMYGASNMVDATIGGSLDSFVVSPGDQSVVLSWTAQNDPGVTGYQYRFRERAAAATDSDGWRDWTATDGDWETMENSSRYQNSWRLSHSADETLVNGVEYQFQVRTTGGKTYISDAKAAVVGIPLTGLTATPGNEQVTLSWTLPTYPPGSVTQPVNGYEVRYSEDGGATWVIPTTPAADRESTDNDTRGGWRTWVEGATASAVVSGLTNGRTYTFQIRADGAALTAGDAFRFSGFGASNMTPAAAGVVSTVPVITGVAPVGPANNNQPVVSGVNAGDRATVNVYTSATCDGSVVTGTADRDGNFSVTVPVANDSTTTFYATSTPRFGGNMSACSAAGMTYVEDSTGPSAMIHGGPAEGSTTASGDAQFLLTASEAGAAFEYSLDGVAFHQLDGQVVTLTALEHGVHTLTVRATDSAGNVGAEVSRSWEVERANPRGCTIWGTDGDDQLVGTAGNDVICGLGGNDVISGLGGNDVIYGDAGGDVINGGSGDDRIYAGSGNDRVNGNAGDDMIRGGGGVDTIRGGKGDDTIYGNAGDDTIYGDKGSDMIHGGPGNDTAMVGSGDRARSIENRL